MEAFARPFLLSSLVEAAGETEVSSRNHEFLRREVSEGLGLRGDRPAWPAAQPGSTTVVEAASLALSLWVTGSQALAAFTPRDRDRLLGWLSQNAEYAKWSRNNWRLFGAVIHGYLGHFLDSKKHRTGAAEALGSIQGWYFGDGWYSDGPGRTFDYYNSYSFHFYPPLIAFLSGDSAECSLYSSRLSDYLQSLRQMIGTGGHPVHWGRSLTYRFGLCAPLSVAALLDPQRTDLAELRSETAACVNLFLDHPGARDTDGVIPNGWLEPTQACVQRYSGPLASYWFSKLFVNLLLPVDSNYWNIGQSSETSRRGAKSLSVGLLLQPGAAGETIRLVNHGSYDRTATDLRFAADDPFYSRLEYSTHSGPTHDDSRESLSGSIVVRIGKKRYVRCKPKDVMARDDRIESLWWMRRLDLREPQNRWVRASRRIAFKFLERWTAPRVRISTTACDEGWLTHQIGVHHPFRRTDSVRFTGLSLSSTAKWQDGEGFAIVADSDVVSMLVADPEFASGVGVIQLRGNAWSRENVAPYVDASGSELVVSTYFGPDSVRSDTEQKSRPDALVRLALKHLSAFTRSRTMRVR